MAITDSLSDIWHTLEDKAWGLADFLENKGIPLASFCESKGVSPVFIFAGIIIAVLLLFALASGGGGPAGVLNVTVIDSQGSGVDTYVRASFSTGQPDMTQKTDVNGKTTFKNVPYSSVTVSIVDSAKRYTGKESITVSKASQDLTITAEVAKATLTVIAQSKEGGYLEKGSIEVRDQASNRVAGTGRLDGSASYGFELPLGQYKVVLLSVSGTAIGTETVNVNDQKAFELTVEADESAVNSASVTVAVTDETGAAVPGAQVILKNGRNEQTIESLTADADGRVTFGNIAIGTSVYPVVFVLNNKRYGQLSDYESKANPSYKITVGELLETISVILPLNGRAEVLVWDKDKMSYISGASVYMKTKAGQTIGTTKLTDSQGKATFTGFEENLDVYPVVAAEGYLAYENPGDAKRISHEEGVTASFGIGLTRDGSYVGSVISINATNVYGDYLTGMDAVLSEAGVGFVKKLSNSNGVSFAVDSSKIYNVALHKARYLWQLLEGIGPGSRSVGMAEANNVNAGDVKVCAFVMINGQASPGSATVELYKSGVLIDRGETAGGSDGSNCITFSDIPEEWTVSAHVESDGYEPVDTDSYEVLSREDGVTSINVTFNQLPPNAAATGDIKVCVTGPSGNAVSGAEVLLYDEEMDAPSWGGNYRLSTVADGCVIFTGIPIEKTNYAGVLSTVRVYPIVSASGYATYNGKAEGNTAAVKASTVTPVTVRLGAGSSICISVKSSGKALQGADVSLCANAPCTQILETKSTDSDGKAVFSTDVASVTVKVVANDDALLKETKKSFTLSQVSSGQCGAVDLPKVAHYATISIDGNSMMQVTPGESGKSIDIIVRVDDKLATGGSLPTGGQNMVSADDGTKVLIEITGGISDGIIQTRDAAAGKYSIPFIAPSTSGTFQVSISASIPSCQQCQGDQKLITIVVGNGDSDEDGVSDQYDHCPSTPWGTAVDSTGCPSASLTDTDGDGIFDTYDNCPGTRSGLRVDSKGCEIASATDTNKNSVPDSYDAVKAAQQQQTYDGNGNGIPDIYESTQMQQSSMQVCVFDDVGAPVYDSSILVYNTGYGSGHGSGYGTGYGSGYGTGHGSGYGTGYGSGYGTGSPNYGTGYGYPYSYGQYNTGYPNGYGQQWQSSYARDNCKTFIGYSSMQYNNYANNPLSYFRFGVSAKGYESYDSSRDGSTAISFDSWGAGGGISVRIVLKRGKASGQLAGGDITNPARYIDLKSASWKTSTKENSGQPNMPQGTAYPLMTQTDRNIQLTVKYVLKTAATTDLTYSVKYALSGNPCIKLEDADATSIAGKSLAFRSGQASVEDTLVLSSDDSCWAANKADLERDFAITMDGSLIEVGGKESTAKTHFVQTRANIKPLVGATKTVTSVSDLTKLNGAMGFSDGVITTGALPYCMSDAANTARSSRVSASPGGQVSDRTAGNYKIVIEFKESNQLFPTSLNDVATRITEYIKERVRKSPMDCKVYINTYNKYKGYVEVGQSGTACKDASVTVTNGKKVEPWQKLFCDTVLSGVQTEMQLDGSYSMKIDTK